MLSAVIPSAHSYSAMLLAEQQIHQRCVHSGPLVLRMTLLNFPTPTTDRDQTVWTQLAYRFNWRTAKPLGPAPAPGCDEPTSRCQTSPSIWTLGGDKPVIPGVPFVRLAMALPLGTTGSLRPTFVPARDVSLAVKPPYAFILYYRFLFGLRWPLHASVTL